MQEYPESHAPDLRTGSQVSSSDGKRVRWPNWRASTWSMETPAWMRVALLLSRTPVRNVPLPRAWSPAPSGPGSAVRWFNSPRTCTYCWHDSSGWSVRLHWKLDPSPVGHQADGMAPLGKKMNAVR